MFSIEQLAWNHLPLLQPNCMLITLSLLDGLRVQFKMYTRFCPWLLTWSDYEEGYEDDGEEDDDADAN
jgi:hypothetical protein